MIRITHVHKTYKSRKPRAIVRALDDVSLYIPQGELIGVLGPNGAGKTTLLNILSTILAPDAGTVTMLGLALNSQNLDRIRGQLNMCSGFPNFPWSLSVRENLSFYGRLYGLRGRELRTRVDELVTMFGLERFYGRRFDELSSGTKQRMALAKSLLNRPRVLLLDEPTIGLDPDVSLSIRREIVRLWQEHGITIILTTHNMKEAQELCQRIAFLKDGRIVRVASPLDLAHSQGKTDLEEVFVSLARDKDAKPVAIKSQHFDIKEDRVDTLTRQRQPLFGRLRMWLGQCLAFSLRNYLFAMRNIFAFVELLFWPLVTLISLGLMGGFLELEKNKLAFILSGAVAGGVLQVTQLDVAYSFLYDVWSKSVKHTMLAPVMVSTIGIGSWLNGVVRGSVIFAVLVLAGRFFFGFTFPSPAITVMFLAGIFGCALLAGLLVSLLILRFGQRAEISAWMFSYLFMLICGVYYPVETLPVGWQAVARLLPLTYFLEYFRSGLGFAPTADHILAKGIGLTLLYLGLELIALRASFNAARRNGTIVRLSE